MKYLYEKKILWCEAEMARRSNLRRRRLYHRRSQVVNYKYCQTSYNVRPIMSGCSWRLPRIEDRYIDQEKDSKYSGVQASSTLSATLLPVRMSSSFSRILVRRWYRRSGREWHRGKLMTVVAAAWIEWRFVLIGIKSRVFHEWIKRRVV